MRIEIDEQLFVKMIDSVKHCVAKAGTRMELYSIKLKIADDRITAYACDGVRAARTTIKLAIPTGCEFDCYIKPIKIKPGKRSGVVSLEKEEDIVSITVDTEYGTVKYHFKQYITEWIDIDRVYEATKACDRKIGMDADYVKQALTALKAVTPKMSKCVIMESQEKTGSSVVFWVKDKNCISEQLILPMRIKDEMERSIDGNSGND